MLKIIADENIPYVREAFGRLGDVECHLGREMTAKTLRDADVLLVRSVTRVDADLLDGSSVRFVGTATIGTDHIDKDYLADRGIAFSSAAGSNANSVAEYVIAAMLTLAQDNGWVLQGKSIGIIGVGNIGSILERKVQALGVRPLPNDPPLQRQSGDTRFVSLDEALGADFVTCHVPLTRGGRDATWHLLDEAKLGQLHEDTVLINSSRGGVVDNVALKAALECGSIKTTVLDVWESEPNIDMELLKRVKLGSSHIAGYSLDGKVNGTVMLYGALCEMLGRADTLCASNLLPGAAIAEIQLDTTDKSDQQFLAEATGAIYDITRDDRDLRQLTDQPKDKRGAFFDQLRKNYPIRREAHNTLVKLCPHRDSAAKKLATLGFRLG